MSAKRIACPRLYAPAEPFGRAIDHWLHHQELLAGYPLRDQPGRNNGTGMVAIAGLGELANLAGTTGRALYRYRTGESRLIELRLADRLAIALDIPLPLLADDFRTMHEWRQASQLKVAA